MEKGNLKAFSQTPNCISISHTDSALLISSPILAETTTSHPQPQPTKAADTASHYGLSPTRPNPTHRFRGFLSLHGLISQAAPWRRHRKGLQLSLKFHLHVNYIIDLEPHEEQRWPYVPYFLNGCQCKSLCHLPTRSQKPAEVTITFNPPLRANNWFRGPWWFSQYKESACNAGDMGSTPGLGRSPGEGNGYPLQHSCLRNPTEEEPGGPCVLQESDTT